MARTKGITKAKQEAPDPIGRCIEYKHAHIGKSLAGNGFFYAIFDMGLPTERRTLCGDPSAARHIIDDDEQEESIQSDPPQRGRRTRGVKVTEKKIDTSNLSHGGYLMNPPSDCKFKCRFDKEPVWWVDAILCHGTCSQSHHCPTFTQFMAGQRLRIKLQNTERLKEECPFCKAGVASRTEHGITVTYSCGTVGDRLTQSYEQGECKKPKKKENEKRGRRRK